MRPVAALTGLDAVITAAVLLDHGDRADLPAVPDGRRRRHNRAQQVFLWPRLAGRINAEIGAAIFGVAVQERFPIGARAAQAGRLVGNERFPPFERLTRVNVPGDKLAADQFGQHAARLGRIGAYAVQDDAHNFDRAARNLDKILTEILQPAHVFEQAARSFRAPLRHTSPAGL